MNTLSSEEFAGYCSNLTQALPSPSPLLERRFEIREDWLRSFELRQFKSDLFQKTKPTLRHLLTLTRAVVLGEPGEGKTTIAEEAARQLCQAPPGRVVQLPVLVRLRTYWNSLSELVAHAVPSEAFLSAESANGIPLQRVYILDGLDEIPPAALVRATQDIELWLERDPNARVLATSRQAFFERRRSMFQLGFQEYYVLPFSDEQINDFLRFHNVPLDRFRAAAARLDLEESLGTPLMLEALAAAFRAGGALPAKRNYAVASLIDTILQRRKLAKPELLRRSLQLIALAMEVKCQNVLDEATTIRLLSAGLGVRVSEIDELLDDLSRLFLVRGEDGFAFQIRSFGEYLAAEALAAAPLSRIQELLLVPGTSELNDSWANALCSLVELNDSARAFFLHAAPIALLHAHPNAFTESEKRVLYTHAKRFVDKTPVLLLASDVVRGQQLARVLPPEEHATLRREAQEPRMEARANALYLLGLAGDRTILDCAIEHACDTSEHADVRLSAMAAIMKCGDAALIPRLIPRVEAGDPLKENLVDAIGALVDRSTLRDVLPLLENTRMMLSNAFHGFSQFESEEDIIEILDYFVAHPGSVVGRRLSSYVGHIWQLIPRVFSPALARRLGAVLAAMECSGVSGYDFDEGHELASGIAAIDPDGLVAEAFFADALPGTPFLRYTGSIIGRMLTPRVAQWLVENPVRPLDAAELRMLASYAPADAAAILAPDAFAPTGQTAQPAVEDRTNRSADADHQPWRDAILNSPDLEEVLRASSRFERSYWPELQPLRRDQLGAMVNDALARLEPLRSVVWTSANTWTSPYALRFVLDLEEHYLFRIENDVHLVACLLASRTNLVVRYYQRYGLSVGGMNVLEHLLNPSSVPAGALHSVLAFLEKTEIASPGIVARLQELAESERFNDTDYAWAVRLLHAKGASDAVLRGLAESTLAAVADAALKALVERQDVTTIQALAGTIMVAEPPVDASALGPNDGQFDWLLKVRTSAAFDTVAELRAYTLEKEFPNLCGIVTDALAQIDVQRAAETVRRQIAIAPRAWFHAQQRIATGLERKARIARSKPDSTEALLMKVLGTDQVGTPALAYALTLASHFRYSLSLLASALVVNILGNFASAALEYRKVTFTLLLLLAWVVATVLEWRRYRRVA